MLSSTSVLGAALVSWNSTDGITRLKTKKEQPPRPLIKACGLDSVSLIHFSNRIQFKFKILLQSILRIREYFQISIMKSSPDCGQLWIGYVSGRIVVYACTIGVDGKIDFTSTSSSVLLAHRSQITAIDLSRAFSVAISGDNKGVLVIWDLNRYAYILSYTNLIMFQITSRRLYPSQIYTSYTVIKVKNQCSEKSIRCENERVLYLFILRNLLSI